MDLFPNIPAPHIGHFTIPDNKYFVIEINEKNGGRHIYYKIRNREIEQADHI